MKIGIIGAMKVEVNALKEKLNHKQSSVISGMEFCVGGYGKHEVITAVAGIGKVNAAMCAQTMILTYKPDVIINTGVAGGIGKGLKVMDVVVATQVVQHDMDTSPAGDPVGLISGLNLVHIPCDEGMRLSLCAAAQRAGVTPHEGLIASGDQFIASTQQIERITKHFDAIAAEMEGAAIGQVCAINRVPFAVVRAISDGGDEAATMSYPQFVELAAAKSVEILVNFLQN